MLKNKRNREKVQMRQHQKDRDYLPPNPDVHVLQHTVNIDTIPDQIPGAQGSHTAQGSQGGSYSSYYSPDKTSPYNQNSSISVNVAGSSEQPRHQRFPQQKPHDLASGSANYQSSNIQQPSHPGRASHSNVHTKEIQGSSTYQTSNGGSQEHSRSYYDRKGHQKPHRPGNTLSYDT